MSGASLCVRRLELAGASEVAAGLSEVGVAYLLGAKIEDMSGRPYTIFYGRTALHTRAIACGQKRIRPEAIPPMRYSSEQKPWRASRSCHVPSDEVLIRIYSNCNSQPLCAKKKRSYTPQRGMSIAFLELGDARNLHVGTCIKGINGETEGMDLDWNMVLIPEKYCI